MNVFVKAFARQDDGSWLCIAPAEWAGPLGRIQVTQGARFPAGTIFMGVELAKLLEEHYQQSVAKVAGK